MKKKKKCTSNTRKFFCCLYGLKMIVRCITMPVYRFNLIWSPATRLVNRDRSDKGGLCRSTPCFQLYNTVYTYYGTSIINEFKMLLQGCLLHLLLIIKLIGLTFSGI